MTKAEPEIEKAQKVSDKAKAEIEKPAAAVEAAEEESDRLIEKIVEIGRQIERLEGIFKSTPSADRGDPLTPVGRRRRPMRANIGNIPAAADLAASAMIVKLKDDGDEILTQLTAVNKKLAEAYTALRDAEQKRTKAEEKLNAANAKLDEAQKTLAAATEARDELLGRKAEADECRNRQK